MSADLNLFFDKIYTKQTIVCVRFGKKKKKTKKDPMTVIYNKFYTKLYIF